MATQELIRNTAVTIGTSPVVISEEQHRDNAQRVFISFINTSTANQKISISVADDATAGSGVVLSAGGFYTESKDSGFIPTNKRFIAVSDAAGGTLAIQERIEMRQ